MRFYEVDNKKFVAEISGEHLLKLSEWTNSTSFTYAHNLSGDKLFEALNRLCKKYTHRALHNEYSKLRRKKRKTNKNGQ